MISPILSLLTAAGALIWLTYRDEMSAAQRLAVVAILAGSVGHVIGWVEGVSHPAWWGGGLPSLAVQSGVALYFLGTALQRHLCEIRRARRA